MKLLQRYEPEYIPITLRIIHLVSHSSILTSPTDILWLCLAEILIESAARKASS